MESQSYFWLFWSNYMSHSFNRNEFIFRSLLFHLCFQSVFFGIIFCTQRKVYLCDYKFCVCVFLLSENPSQSHTKWKYNLYWKEIKKNSYGPYSKYRYAAHVSNLNTCGDFQNILAVQSGNIWVCREARCDQVRRECTVRL